MFSTSLTTRATLNHDELVLYLKAFGYSSDGYACYGYAGASIPALLLGKADRFNRRLSLMKAIFNAHADLIRRQTNMYDLLKLVLSSGLPDYALSRKDKNIIKEIPAFCESVVMHYQPEEYHEWFPRGAAPNSQNLAKTLPLMLPRRLPAIAFSPVFTGTYNKERNELLDYFSSYVDTLISCKLRQPNANKLVLLICNISHSMAVSYDALKMEWSFADVCHEEIAFTSMYDRIIHLVNHYLTDERNITVFSTQLFSSNQETVDLVYNTWRNHPKWEQLHHVDLDKMERLDWNEADWAQVAAQNADMDALKKIIQLTGADLDYYFNYFNYRKSSALLLAIEEGHACVVNFMLANGVNPDYCETESPLKVACDLGHKQLIKLLLVYGANSKLVDHPLVYSCKNELSSYFFSIVDINLKSDDPSSQRTNAIKALRFYVSSCMPHEIDRAVNHFKQIESVYQRLKTFKPNINWQSHSKRNLSGLVDSAFAAFAAAPLQTDLLPAVVRKSQALFASQESVADAGLFGNNSGRKRKDVTESESPEWKRSRPAYNQPI